MAQSGGGVGIGAGRSSMTRFNGSPHSTAVRRAERPTSNASPRTSQPKPPNLHHLTIRACHR